MKIITLTAVLTCSLVATSFAQEDAGERHPDLPEYEVFGEAASPEDGEAIGNLMREFAMAWGRSDAEAAAAAYSDDAEWTNSFGNVVRGADQLERFFTRLFADFDDEDSSGEEESYRSISMRYLGDDAAIVHGVTTSTRGSAVDGSGKRQVFLTYVLAKEAGKWRIVHQVIMDARV